MDYRMLINGQLVSGAHMRDVTNPATEEVFARVPHATGAQLDEAVTAATSAQKAWAGTRPEEHVGAKPASDRNGPLIV